MAHQPTNHPSSCPLRSAQIAAFLPAKGRFVADEVELEERPKGPLQDPRISILEPKKVSLTYAVPILPD